MGLLPCALPDAGAWWWLGRPHCVGSVPCVRLPPPRVVGLSPLREGCVAEAEAGPSCDYPHYTSPLGFFPFSKKKKKKIDGGRGGDGEEDHRQKGAPWRLLVTLLWEGL